MEMPSCSAIIGLLVLFPVSPWLSSIHSQLSSCPHSTPLKRTARASRSYPQVPARLLQPKSLRHTTEPYPFINPASPCRNTPLRNAAHQQPQARMIRALTCLVRYLVDVIGSARLRRYRHPSACIHLPWGMCSPGCLVGSWSLTT